jgi:FHA domain-containing protein
VSGILARIKALFAPSRAAAPPPVAELPPASAPAVTEPAEAAIERVEPIVVAVEPTLAPLAAPAAEEAPFPENAPLRAQPAVTAPPAGGLVLRLESERGSPLTWEVTKSGATIGRGPESTIKLADLSVSRKHARITYKQGAYWVSDLGSMGGTWIDGAKLAAPRRVATGQTIDIGLCRLVVVSAEAAEESASAKGPTHAA